MSLAKAAILAVESAIVEAVAQERHRVQRLILERIKDTTRLGWQNGTRLLSDLFDETVHNDRVHRVTVIETDREGKVVDEADGQIKALLDDIENEPPPPKHIPNEEGDCPRRCPACRAEREKRKAPDGRYFTPCKTCGLEHAAGACAEEKARYCEECGFEHGPFDCRTVVEGWVLLSRKTKHLPPAERVKKACRNGEEYTTPFHLDRDYAWGEIEESGMEGLWEMLPVRLQVTGPGEMTEEPEPKRKPKVRSKRKRR